MKSLKVDSSELSGLTFLRKTCRHTEATWKNPEKFSNLEIT